MLQLIGTFDLLDDDVPMGAVEQLLTTDDAATGGNSDSDSGGGGDGEGYDVSGVAAKGAKHTKHTPVPDCALSQVLLVPWDVDPGRPCQACAPHVANGIAAASRPAPPRPLRESTGGECPQAARSQRSCTNARMAMVILCKGGRRTASRPHRTRCDCLPSREWLTPGKLPMHAQRCPGTRQPGCTLRAFSCRQPNHSASGAQRSGF